MKKTVDTEKINYLGGYSILSTIRAHATGNGRSALTDYHLKVKPLPTIRVTGLQIKFAQPTSVQGSHVAEAESSPRSSSTLIRPNTLPLYVTDRPV